MRVQQTLAGNAFLKLANMAVVFVTTIVLGRAMGVEGYGALSLLLLNAVAISLFTSFGLDAGITYVVATKPGLRHQAFTAALLLPALQAAVVGLGVWGWNATTGHALGSATVQIWMFVVLLFSVSAQDKLSALLHGGHHFSGANRTVLAANSLLLMAALVALAMLGKGHTGLYGWIFTSGTLLAALLLLVVVNRLVRPRWTIAFTPDTRQLFFRYSSVAFVANLVQFLAYRMDLWLLAMYRNDTELGWYALMVRLAQLLWVLPTVFAGILLPQISRQGERFDRATLHALLRFLNVANAAAVVFGWLFGRALVRAVFGADYEPGAVAFLILLPGVAAFANATLLAAYFAGMNRLRINLWGSVFCFAVVALLDLWLIPIYGFTGAAVASSVAYGLTALYFLLAYTRATRVPLRDLLLPRKQDWLLARRFPQQLFSAKP